MSDAVSVPWAVLSAGVDHEAFCGQLSASLAGGAAGFIAGRSLWKEAATLAGGERRAFLEDTVRRRSTSSWSCSTPKATRRAASPRGCGRMIRPGSGAPC